MSRQAALSRVIWSAIVNVVKPGSCLANSTVLIMHLVDNSLNLSQRLTSSETRCSELLLCRVKTTLSKDSCFCDMDYAIEEQVYINIPNLHKDATYLCQVSVFLVFKLKLIPTKHRSMITSQGKRFW